MAQLGCLHLEKQWIVCSVSRAACSGTIMSWVSSLLSIAIEVSMAFTVPNRFEMCTNTWCVRTHHWDELGSDDGESMSWHQKAVSPLLLKVIACSHCLARSKWYFHALLRSNKIKSAHITSNLKLKTGLSLAFADCDTNCDCHGNKPNFGLSPCSIAMFKLAKSLWQLQQEFVWFETLDYLACA